METVTENKVLTQEELQTLKKLQENTQTAIIELGEIELTSIQLQNRKENVKNFLIEISNQEKEFTKSVFEKYGKCNVNPQTGEITLIS
jgi:hypothetical protein